MRQIRRSVFETNSSSTHSLVYKSKDPSELPEGKIPNYYLNDDGTWNINFGQYHWTSEVPLKRWYEKLNYLMTLIAYRILANLKDLKYTAPSKQDDYTTYYHWNHYDDKNAQQRWNDACKILDNSEPVKQIKELIIKYCDTDAVFTGFNYCWWDCRIVDEFTVQEVFEDEVNTINHPFWHDSFYRDKYGCPEPRGAEAFSGFGSIDHQSLEEDGLYELIENIGFETYLFSEDIMVIIDHDNH